MDPLPHHVQQNLCTSRPQYRQGRKLTAIKVYTIASESRHLLFHGVPDLNLRNELKSKLSKYGKLENLAEIPNYKGAEQFTKVYHAVFCDIKCARFAKRKLDATSFYGGIFHVCYAPEMESIEDVKLKMDIRKADVIRRLRNNARTPEDNPPISYENSNQCGVTKYENQQQETSHIREVYGPQLPAMQISHPTIKKLIPKMFIPRQLQKRLASTSQDLLETIQNKRTRKD